MAVLAVLAVALTGNANAQWWVPTNNLPQSLEGTKFEREPTAAPSTTASSNQPSDTLSPEPVKWFVVSTGKVQIQRGFLRFSSHPASENQGVFVKIGTPSSLAPATTTIQSEPVASISTLLYQVAYEGWLDGSDMVSYQICDQLGKNCRELSVQHFAAQLNDAEVRETYRTDEVKVTVVGDSQRETAQLPRLFISNVLFPTALTGLYSGREFVKAALEAPSDQDRRVVKIKLITRGYHEFRIAGLVGRK